MPEQTCECCGTAFHSAYVRLMCRPCRRGGCCAFDGSRVCVARTDVPLTAIDDGQ